MRPKIAVTKNISSLQDVIISENFDYLFVGDWTNKSIKKTLDFYNRGCRQYAVCLSNDFSKQDKERGCNVTYLSELTDKFCITKEIAMIIYDTNSYKKLSHTAKSMLNRGILIINLWDLHDF